MKRWVLWFTVVILLAGAAAYTYGQYFSAPARIKAAGSAFMRAAVAGDEATIEHLLAPDSPLKAADIALLYHGDSFNNYNVYPVKALPNGSGVEWLANTSTISMANPGYPRGTTLAFKRVDGRWLLYQAGQGFSL